MAIWAIGDVQGCYEELRRLIDRIRFDPALDRLWFVGDLVNRGPGSLETLRWVKSLGAAALTVLGNHDLHLIACAHGFGRQREDDTLDAVLRAGDRAELVDWLCGLPLMHVEGSRAMVHAGLLPQWTVARARALATEIEAQLQGAQRGRFLERLYGSRPEAWDDGLEGPDRHRVIVNAMTRMRFCTAGGRMDFHAKGEHAPPGYLPWFEVPRRASAGTTVVCGHWSALGLKLSSDLIALDAGCVWGGALTAVRLDDRRVVQVECGGVRAPERGDRPSGSDRR